jgi:signal peptidase II
MKIFINRNVKMKADKVIRNLLVLILLAGNVGCDQVSKSIVRQRIDSNERISLIDNFVTLTKVENTGAFLSLGHYLPRALYKILMIILPLIVLGYSLWYLLTRNSLPKLLTFGISLIAGGGIGNICDRIIYGSVTDFLQFDFVIFHTGIVNLADISIMAGFFILIYELWIKKSNRRIVKQSEIITR